MKKAFVSLPCKFLVLFALVCSAALVGQAQNREKFVISAKAGGVNAVSGDVTFQHGGAGPWRSLSAKDDLDTGDVVRTGANGLVEVLLNPGTYLRLPQNSQFEMTDTALDALRLKLISGSAIVEAAGIDGGETHINVLTPQTQIALVRKGVYRINVMPSGQTELVVRNGRALVGAEELKVKGGNKVMIGGANASAAPLELVKYDKKKERDQFDIWSQERAETLAKANEKLSARALNGFFSDFSRIMWDNLYGANRDGIWFFNPGLRCYTFLPFSQGWGSPYGHSYITSIYYYPRAGNNPYYGGQPGGPIPGSGGGASGGASGSGGSSGGPIRSTPMPSGGGDNPMRQSPGHKASPTSID